MTKPYNGSLIDDCAAIVALGENLKNPPKPKRHQKTCRCSAYPFPHRLYSKACYEASVFSRPPWNNEPRPLGAPIGYPFKSEADEHNHFFEQAR